MINRNQIDIIKKAYPLYVNLTNELKSFIKGFEKELEGAATIHEIIIPAISLMLGDMLTGTTNNAKTANIVLHEIMNKTQEIISRINDGKH